MFVDLVGSTEMSESHEPEVVRDVLRRYHDVCASAIHGHRGYIARYEGDGLMAYFGYPAAREDDALQAVQAGLELLSGLEAAAPGVMDEFGIDLEARVGVHTGLVLVTAMGAPGSEVPDAVIGAAPNEAARLQSLASAGSLVISDDTHEIVRGYVDVESIGRPRLKGIGRDVEVFRVVGLTGAAHRLQAAGTTRTRLVGRQEEQRALLQRWNAVVEGDSRAATRPAMLIRGEVGIGKSRLAELIVETARDDGATVLTAFCAVDRQASRLFPVCGMFERAFDVLGTDDATRLATLEQRSTALGLDPDDTVPFVADVLGIPSTGRFSLPVVDPNLLREKTFSALCSMIRAVAHETHAILLVEDLQWADQTTLELLSRLTATEPPMPLLIVGTARPEFAAWWAGTDDIIELGRLPRPHHMELIEELARVYGVPKDFWDAIAARSDGNPLFAEELAKTMGDAEHLPQNTDAIPRTIRGLLTARLDALGADKRLAQCASVVGREIDSDLLRIVSGTSRRQLATGLEHLTVAGIVEPIANAQPPVSHQFVHALVRDAAYASQEQGQRLAAHRRLASALEERPGADPGLVAYHYDAAHEIAAAIAWYLRAGSAAQMAAANAEAIQHLDRGLELVASLPAAPERGIAELHLRIMRGTSHVNTLGYGAPGAAADFRRSLELSEQVEGGDLAPLTAAVWAYYVVHGDLRAAAEAARRLEELGGPELEPEILCCIGVQRFFEGRCREAHTVLEASVAGFERRRPEERASRRWLLPSDAFCVALTHLGAAAWLMGETNDSQARFDQAMERARALPHFPTGVFTQAYVASYQALIATLAGRYEDGLALADLTTRLAEQYGMLFWLSTGAAGRALCAGHLGDPRAALEMITCATEQWRSLGAEALLPFVFAQRAHMHQLVGELTEALVDVDEGLALAERTSEQVFSAEAHRIRAAIFRVQINPDAARAELITARDLAAEQGAVVFELRAALDLVDTSGQPTRDDLEALRGVVNRLPVSAELPEIARARAAVERG